MGTLASKSVIVISPVSTTNAGTATGRLDTQGFDYAVIDVCATTTDSATNNFSVLDLAEGDTTSSYANVKVGDTDFTVATQSTSVAAVVASFKVDLRGRKRWLKITASPLTTQTIWAMASLYRGDELSTTAARAGVGVVVEV